MLGLPFRSRNVPNDLNDCSQNQKDMGALRDSCVGPSFRSLCHSLRLLSLSRSTFCFCLASWAWYYDQGLSVPYVLLDLLTTAFSTRTSRSFLHNDGLWCHDCVIGDRGCHGREYEYVDPMWVRDCVHSVHLDE